MSSIVHFRHGLAIGKAEKVLRTLPGDVKFVLIVYDGPSVPAFDRQCSFVSDAPESDVRLVCEQIGKQK